MTCYVDTSAFYAFLVSEDRQHLAVAAAFDRLLRGGYTLFSSSLVLGEILGLLQMRHGVAAADRFMSEIYPMVLWRWIDAPMFAAIWQLTRYTSKRAFTAVDASAVLCIRERPGSVCLAVDPDLAQFGFEVLPHS